MKLSDKSKLPSGFTKTGQGYIVVKASIARTGGMDYFGEEFDRSTREKFKLKPDQSYLVDTNERELFSEKTMKSFEGMPLTIEHPDDLEVKAEDWANKAVGHIQNVRREGENLVCDAYVQHAAAIEYLEKTGVRETSIGQDADIEMVDGKLIKTNIVGNHVAIVPSGRAMSTKLGDRKPKKMSLAKQIMKKIGLRKPKQKLGDAKYQELTQKLTDAEEAIEQLAEDATPEEKAGAVSDVIETVLAALEEAQEIQEEVIDEAASVSTPDEAVVDADPADTVNQDERITELVAENEQLKEENEELKARLSELEGKEETVSVMNDAKARKSKAKLNDGMNPVVAKRMVLVDAGIFGEQEAKKMDKATIDAAYLAYKVAHKPVNTIGKSLLADSKPKATKTASQRLGGK